MSENAAMAVKHHNKTDRSARSSAPEDGVLTADHNQLLQNIGKYRDREAFIQLFEYFAPRVKSFLLKGGTSPEAADELAQETMLTVWNKASNFDPARASAGTWIYTIARNKKVDALRKSVRESIVDFEPVLLEDDSPRPDQEAQNKQEEEAISAALKTLPEDQAKLIHMSFFEGKSHSDIAHETQIPLGTVKSRIRMALERLRGQKSIKELQ